MNRNKILVIISIIIAFQFLSCQHKTNKSTKIDSSYTEHIEGTEIVRVVLTEKAAERLNIITVPVDEGYKINNQSKMRKIVPYSAVIYDKQGNTWVYTNPEPFVYVRSKIIISVIEGENVFLFEGPPKGTMVVKVGALELYGVELKIDQE